MKLEEVPPYRGGAPIPEGYVAVPDAMKKLGVTYASIYHRIKTGKLDALRSPSRNRIYVRDKGANSTEIWEKQMRNEDYRRITAADVPKTTFEKKKAPEGWLSVQQLAEAFSIAEWKMALFIRRMTHHFPRVRVQTRYYYELEKVKQAYEKSAEVRQEIHEKAGGVVSGPAKDMHLLSEGSITSEAFRLFRGGTSMIDAIIELRQPTEKVKKLHEEFAKLKQTLTLEAPQLVALATILHWDEEPPSAEGLVKAARARFVIEHKNARKPEGEELPLSTADNDALQELDKK